MLQNNEVNRRKLATAIVEGWDLGDLICYASETLANDMAAWNDSEFKEEWEFFFDDPLPATEQEPPPPVVRVHFEDKRYDYDTEVSRETTYKKAVDYFVGRRFCVGNGTTENLQTVIGITFNPQEKLNDQEM